MELVDVVTLVEHSIHGVLGLFSIDTWISVRSKSA